MALRIPISLVRSVIVVYIASITTRALIIAASPTSTRMKMPRLGIELSTLANTSRVN